MGLQCNHKTFREKHRRKSLRSKAIKEFSDLTSHVQSMGFPGGTSGKETTNSGDASDLDLIPGSGRSPGEGYGNPLQYSCLENPMDRGTWWATHGVENSRSRL